MYQAIFIRLLASFSEETLQARKEWHDTFICGKAKPCNLRYSSEQDNHSVLKDKKMTFSVKKDSKSLSKEKGATEDEMVRWHH